MELSEYRPITLPLEIAVGRKNYRLSSNNQKKWYFHLEYHIKARFQQVAQVILIMERWKPIEQFPIGIRYEYWLPPNADYENFHALVCKYFQDAMVQMKLIPDDNPVYIVESTVRYMGTRYKNDGIPEVIISLYEV